MNCTISRPTPHEIVNRIDDPALAGTKKMLMAQLYRQLRERHDNFYHWMTSMFDVGNVDYDPTLSAFENPGTSTNK